MPLDPPEFARNPADALQCYADLQQSVAEDFANPDTAVARLLLGHLDDQDREAITGWWREFFTHPDPQSSIETRIYFWPAHTAAAVGEQAVQYPIALERFELPVRRHLLFFFQRPTLSNDEAATMPFSAVSCYHDGTAACIWPWHWQHGRCTPWPPSWGTSPSSIIYQRALAWLCAAESFAAQRLIGAELTTINRKVRNRVRGHVPDVQVVRLRGVESSRSHHAPLYHIDFDFRFWVRGHERHLANREEPIWIQTYLKGPENRPIKERPTLYAVTR